MAEGEGAVNVARASERKENAAPAEDPLDRDVPLSLNTEVPRARAGEKEARRARQARCPRLGA